MRQAILMEGRKYWRTPKKKDVEASRTTVFEGFVGKGTSSNKQERGMEVINIGMGKE